MKSFRWNPGRRKFLISASVVSASALALKRLGGAIAPAFQTGVASASEKNANAGMKGVFSNRYSHLLSPLKIGNVILKNRMMHTQSLPHFFQGPETFPSDQIISHYAGVARNGAAIVTVWEADLTPLNDGTLRNRRELFTDNAHMPMWDAADAGVQNYFTQLTDAIHFYDSKASISVRISSPQGYTISNVPIKRTAANEIPVELIEKMIEDYAKRAKFYQTLGFDMINIHMSYNSDVLAHALSSGSNKRTDKYGGSVENRARLPLEIFQAFKKVCGQDFLVAAHMGGEEREGGYTIQDTVQFAKIWEGSLDILKLRAKNISLCHPTCFNMEEGKPLTLRYAQAIKEGGSKIITAPTGGFQDLDLLEEYIASGKTDMIAMARSWIADPEYGKKAYEGRGEDVVPCVLCNGCHGISMEGPWLNFCTVNPKMGISHKVERMIDAPAVSRKVAVIGGGPAGMKAAIVAAERGHKVTLYEKNDFLGGQLRHTDFASFKWPLRKFKDYLIRQTYKAGVQVLLNTRATPEMIKAKGYDAILVAIGADPFIPDIPGAKSSNVLAPIFVFGNETVGTNVVVIGGGKQIGTETGMYLAQKGHKVTVLTEEKSLATDANQVHFIDSLRSAWEALHTFSYVTEVTATRISEGKVYYKDATGAEKSIQADSVVIYAGRKPRQDEALKFCGSAERFFAIGDCRAQGDVRICMRNAFAAASQI
jgi:2,4-dienoyl-CoA reductase-like NADH-dependent reductase (Old Yellow Enzyme family)/thioredoxin reductase